MKYLTVLAVFFLISHIAAAQSTRSGTSEYNGQKYPCQTIGYNLPPAEMENVIKNQLKKAGYSPAKSKGYLVYRNIKLPALNNNTPQDIFFKVDRLSRKESEKSLVTLITAGPGEIPESKIKGSKSLAHLTGAASGERLLESFGNEVKISAHHLAIDNQSKEIIKYEKELESLQKEQSKLEKKLQDLEADLKKNKEDQETHSSQIAEKKSLLEEMKKTPTP